MDITFGMRGVCVVWRGNEQFWQGGLNITALAYQVLNVLIRERPA